MTEQLSDQPPGAVAFNSGAHLSSRCYSEAGRTRLAFPREHGHEASGALESCLIDEFEVGPLPDVLGGPESWHVRLLLVGDGETLSALGAAALQHLPAVFGRHAHQEAVTLGAAGGVRLKRSLALLGPGHSSPLNELPIIDLSPGSGRQDPLCRRVLK